MASREPHSPITAERVLLVRGRLAMIWRCPWCTARQETITDPPEHGAPPALDATCRKCERRFRVQPPEGA
jgi:hypothetical protein